jgi:hypothetical protein
MRLPDVSSSLSPRLQEKYATGALWPCPKNFNAACHDFSPGLLQKIYHGARTCSKFGSERGMRGSKPVGGPRMFVCVSRFYHMADMFFSKKKTKNTP